MGAPPRTVSAIPGQKTPAPGLHGPPGGLKVPGVPGVRHLAAPVGELRQQVDLPLRITAADPPHVPEVLLVHTDEEVIVLIIPPGQEPGGVPLAGDAVLRQLAPRRGIDRVPDLLPGGGGGGDGETPLLPRPPDEVLHGVLRHGAPADIPMANKKNFCHQALFLSRSPGIGLSSAW